MSDQQNPYLASSQRSVVPDYGKNGNQPVAPPAPAPTWGQTLGANWTLARQDQAGARTVAEDHELASVVDRLEAIPDDRPWWQKLGGDRYLRPEQGENLSETKYDRDAVYAGMAAHPELFKELPFRDDASLQTYVHGRRATARSEAQDVVARETGAEHVLGFGAGAAAGLIDPINIAGMGATGGIAGGARTLIGATAREALINAGLTAVQEPTMIASRHEFGEQTSAGDVATDIAEGAAGGAALHIGGVAVKASVGAAVRRLFPKSDADVAAAFSEAVPAGNRTPDQQAALNIVNRQTDIDASNPFIATPPSMDVHAARLTGAMQQLATMDTPRPASLAAAPGSSPTNLSPDRVIRFVMGNLEGGAAVVHYGDVDGGTTRYGIAAKFNPGVDVAHLTQDDAASIARRKYWLPEFDRADPRTAAVAFDASYLAGPEEGRRVLAESGGDPDKALALYRGYLDHLADTNPAKAKYRNGWNRRLDKLAGFVGGSEDRLALRPDVTTDADDLAASQRQFDQADIETQLLDQEEAYQRASAEDRPEPETQLSPVMEASARADDTVKSTDIAGSHGEPMTAEPRLSDDRASATRETSDGGGIEPPAIDQRPTFREWLSSETGTKGWSEQPSPSDPAVKTSGPFKGHSFNATEEHLAFARERYDAAYPSTDGAAPPPLEPRSPEAAKAGLDADRGSILHDMRTHLEREPDATFMDETGTEHRLADVVAGLDEERSMIDRVAACL